MAEITITSLSNKSVSISPGSKNVLEGIHAHYIDWMHACGGKGRCTTCKMVVYEGMEHFSGFTDAELDYKEKGLLRDNERLACQVKLSGHARVGVAPENKFPHLKYSD